MSNPRRRHTRVEIADVKAEITSEDGRTLHTDNMENISLGGVFIPMNSPLAFGSEIQLRIDLQELPRVLKCRGFVVWVRDLQNEEGPPGIGVRLTAISPNDMRILSQYIMNAVKQEET